MRTHVVATAGHVDHGKSTLVQALTGMEPDRYAEERRRGMTLDLGFAWTRLGPDSVAFVDVPGHERFVTTTLAGVGPVPAVMLVVAADEGWMPQTAEHAEALAALGVRHGLLVITRSDLLEPDLALAEARERLPGWPAVAVSASTGAGLDALRAALGELVAGLPEPAPEAPVRFWVDRAFTVRGAGTVVTGTLAEGTLTRDDELSLGDRRLVVRGLESLGEPVDAAGGVARVAVNLRGIGVAEIGRGDALCTPGAWLAVSELDGRTHGAADALPREPILHIGSAAVAVRVRPLGDDTVRLRLARPLPLRIGDRVVLRDPGRRHVTGLTVLDVRPPALRRRGAARARAADLATVTGVPDAADELRRRGTVRAVELVAMGVPEVEQVEALRGGGWLLDPARVPALVTALRAAVTAHDRADPLDPGLPVEAARHAVDLPHPALVTALVPAFDDLRRPVSPDELVVRDGRIRRAADAGLPRALREALDAVRADLADTPFAAPDADRLTTLGLGPKQVATLVRAGELSTVGEGIVLLPDAPERAVEILRGLSEPFTLSEAREALGTTRRVAVPLLEHLARRRLTTRTDDGRHRLR